jgi:cobalt-zinc-cadmium efflux system outer membrane protein
MHNKKCIVAVILFVLISFDIFSQSRLGGSLTIETAIEKAIKNNSELQYYMNNIEASKALKYQSGLIPNPEFDIEAENIFGSEDFSGFKGSEITASLSQNILLAGKISKREKVSEMNITLAEWDYEAKRLEIITNIRRAFISALTTQKLIEKNNELIKISNELTKNLSERVKAGKISPAEVSRAKIISNNLQIKITRLEANYDAAIYELTILINDPTLSFNNIIGELKEINELPQYDSLYKMLENNPNIKRYGSEYEKQKAVITYEESKATPDLTISAGYKRLNDAEANTFLVGASVPIPIFNRNQGSIQEAQIRLDQKKNEFETIKNKLILQLNLLYNKLGNLLTTAQKLNAESIPDAEEAFKIIKEGNLVGRFTILDVLDAQRTLFEIDNLYLNIQTDINAVIVEIEGITMKNIN